MLGYCPVAQPVLYQPVGIFVSLRSLHKQGNSQNTHFYSLKVIKTVYSNCLAVLIIHSGSGDSFFCRFLLVKLECMRQILSLNIGKIVPIFVDAAGELW